MDVQINNIELIPESDRKLFLEFINNIMAMNEEEALKQQLLTFASDGLINLDASEIYQLELVKEQYTTFKESVANVEQFEEPIEPLASVDHFSESLTESISQSDETQDWMHDFGGQDAVSDPNTTDLMDSDEDNYIPGFDASNQPVPIEKVADKLNSIETIEDSETQDKKLKDLMDENAMLRDNMQGNIVYGAQPAHQDAGSVFSQAMQGSFNMGAKLAGGAVGAVGSVGALGAGALGATYASATGVINALSDKYQSNQLSMQDRASLTDKQVDQKIVEKRSNINNYFDSKTPEEKQAIVDRVQKNSIIGMQSTVSDIMNGINESSISDHEFSGGLQVKDALKAAAEGSELEKKMASHIIQSEHTPQEINEMLSFRAKEYQALSDTMDSLVESAMQSGMSEEEVFKQIVEPVQNWVEEDQSENTALSQLAEMHNQSFDNNEDAQENRKVIDELMAQIAIALKKLFARDQTQEQDKNNTMGRR